MDLTNNKKEYKKLTKNIIDEIKILNCDITELQSKIKILQNKKDKLENENYTIFKNLAPQCASCGTYSFDMWIATQTDDDEYESEHEGYAGPIIGDWYCGS